jgi:hypothetical protein
MLFSTRPANRPTITATILCHKKDGRPCLKTFKPFYATKKITRLKLWPNLKYITHFDVATKNHCARFREFRLFVDLMKGNAN